VRVVRGRVSRAPSLWVEEAEFADRVRHCSPIARPDFVTGPGRSGAIAAVFASYFLGVPFVSWGQKGPGRRVLIVDTASMSGRTMRKARARYSGDYAVETFVAFIECEQRHHFWFERMAVPA
jgi:hypothetical protein